MSHDFATPFCNDNPDGHLCLLAAGHDRPHECFVDGCGLTWPSAPDFKHLDEPAAAVLSTEGGK